MGYGFSSIPLGVYPHDCIYARLRYTGHTIILATIPPGSSAIDITELRRTIYRLCRPLMDSGTLRYDSVHTGRLVMLS